MKTTTIISLLVLAINSSLSTKVFGFGEDICFKDGVIVTPGAGTGANPPECDPANGDVSDACASLSNKFAQDPSNSTSLKGCISSVHFYGSYLGALLNGFDKEAAFQIASYNETTDYGVYTHYDMSGKPMSNLTTASLNGIVRTTSNTLGDVIHMPIPNQSAPNQVSTIHADSPTEEPMLYQLYSWAMGGKQVCAGALTTPNRTGGNYGGAKCFTGSALPGIRTSLLPQATTFMANMSSVFAPTAPSISMTLPGYTGDQVFQFTSSSSSSSISFSRPQSPIYADGLASLVAKVGSYRGGPVPEVLARIGIFLHSLGDRYSHEICLNATMLKVKDGKFQFNYEDPHCTTKHIGGHVQETGYATIPARTIQNLNDTNKFLAIFGGQHRQFVTGTIYNTSQVNIIMADFLASLAQPTACRRMQAFAKLMADYQLPQLPGYSYNPNLCK